MSSKSTFTFSKLYKLYVSKSDYKNWYDFKKFSLNHYRNIYALYFNSVYSYVLSKIKYSKGNCNN